MRRAIWFVVVALMLVCPAFAEAQLYQMRLDPSTRYGVLHSEATAPADGPAIRLLGQSTATLTVTGTFVGTVAFEVTTDPDALTGWSAIACTPWAGGADVSTVTSAGVWRCDVAGLGTVRARISSYTSGSITVFALVSPSRRAVSQGSGGVTASSTDTFTNKTLDAEGTGNILTILNNVWLSAANCNNVTATSYWDLPTANAAVPACVTGSNTQKGVLDFADGSNLSAQMTYMLPTTWTGTVDAKIKWLSSATTGTVVWQLSSSCVADGQTDDPAFNASTPSFEATKGTANQTNDATITSLNVTGCAAGELIHFKIFRDSAHASDTMAGTARLIGIQLTLREAQ